MNLKAVHGRVVCRVKMNEKGFHRFANGTVIRLERQYNNFDRKHTEISQGLVVDSDYVPGGATILFHHNATHDSNAIFDHDNLSEDPDIRYFSIPEDQCYLWKYGTGEWQPMRNFVTALRVFKPYAGVLNGIPPKKVDNLLYITSGDLKGYICHVLKASDYEIVFNNEHSVEERIIRCRHFGDEANIREEVIAIDHELTDKLNKGELLVGLTVTSASPVKDAICLKQ